MGAIFRVNTYYTSLDNYLIKAKESSIPVYGTFLDGKNIYNEELTKNGILVVGNEGNGISELISNHILRKLYIPSFSLQSNKPESLNAAIATAICCSEFRRRSD
jgi:TrmH family RNA methyltransferase